MLLSVISAAVVSSWINCAGIESSLDQSERQGRDEPSFLSYDQWSGFACNHIVTLGKDAEVRMLSGRSNGLATEQTLEERGRFTVTSLQAGRMHLHWKGEGGYQKEFWLQLKINAPTWVYADNFPLGHQLQARDIELQKRDISSYLGIRELVGAAPVGKSVTKFVRKGGVTFSGDLRPPALVERLSRVKVVVVSGGIVIQTNGVAQSIGWEIGDLVNVRLEDSEKVVQGKITEEGTIHVQI